MRSPAREAPSLSFQVSVLSVVSVAVKSLIHGRHRQVITPHIVPTPSPSLPPRPSVACVARTYPFSPVLLPFLLLPFLRVALLQGTRRGLGFPGRETTPTN
jgi:hypothetical protein